MSNTPTSTSMPASAPALDPAAMQKMEARYRLRRTLTSGADWFFWIAALSVINTVIMLAGGSTSFVTGLGITQVIDVFAAVMKEDAVGGIVPLLTAVNILLDLAVLVLFVIFGVFARKAHRWAFIVGMGLYTLDSLIFLYVQDFLSLAFHAWALFGLFTGYRAISALKKLEYQDAVISPA